jgi:undecaprenyl-diphosphatase
MPRADPRLGETVALGLLQGPAELLPVSSSAHVALLPWALGWRHAALPGAARKEIEVALHAGTALALAAGGPGLRRWRLLIAGAAPPAVAGLLLERVVETRLGTPRSIAAGLLAGAVAMTVADGRPGRRSAQEAGSADGWWLGVAQALALVPGVSRSGATRAAARSRRFGRADAAELSREVALPVLAGAAALKGLRIARRRPGAATGRALGAGAAAAWVSTSAALRASRAGLDEVPLATWAAYRALLAVAILWHDRAG